MLVSIAMAVRNSAAFLPDAIASIAPALAGSGCDFEIVAADGASDDATVAILEATNARVVSRSDGGIYDGMNRALAAAKGDAVLLLNGDDVLPPGSLARAVAVLREAGDAAFASGDAEFSSSEEAGVVRAHRGPLTSEGALFGIAAINARLFRAESVRRLGPLLTDAGLGADREYLLRAHKAGMRGVQVPGATYRYRSHAGSATISGDKAGRARVYRAELQLAAKLAETYRSDAEAARLIRAVQALSLAKLRLSGGEHAGPGPGRVGIADLARSIPLAVKWRGILSGY